MFSDPGWIWVWVTTQYHPYARCVQSTFYSQLYGNGPSSQADRQLWVTGKAKGRRQPCGQEKIMNICYPRQWKASSHLLRKSHWCSFQALHQTPTPRTRIPNRIRKKIVKTPQDKLFLQLYQCTWNPEEMNFYAGNRVQQKWFPEATFSSDLTAFDIQMNLWWALGPWWAFTNPVNYLEFLYIYKNNQHKIKMRRDSQEIVTESRPVV